VRVRGAGGGRVSIDGVALLQSGERPHRFTAARYGRRKGEAKGFTGRPITGTDSSPPNRDMSARLV